MKRGRLPLTALRSFEAAGRLQSFTLAAQELFVSQAAISRQIRDLEVRLAMPLFERHHRSVSLTPAGRRLLTVLTQSFDMIDAGLTELSREHGPTGFTVSAEPSFAAYWLVPHLADFRTLHPGIDVTVDTDSRLIEFRAHEAEIAIRHAVSATSWPRTQATRLTDVEMIAVISPLLLETGPVPSDPADLLNHVLLHEENRSAWGRWFEAAGLSGVNQERGPVFADGALVLQAATRGHGVALVDTFLAMEELKAGRLVQPFDFSIAHGAYWLVVRDFDALSPPARLFADWLMSCFAGDAASSPA